MNYFIRTVDWDWLTSHKDADARREALYSRPKRKIGETEISLASGSMWNELAEVLEHLVTMNFKSKKLIRAGLLCILANEGTPKDDLNLVDMNIVATLSPDSVAEAVKACDAIDFDAIGKAFTDKDLDIQFKPEDLLLYLDGVVKALKKAHVKKRGLVASCG
jgi:hypothetical protein